MTLQPIQPTGKPPTTGLAISVTVSLNRRACGHVVWQVENSSGDAEIGLGQSIPQETTIKVG